MDALVRHLVAVAGCAASVELGGGTARRAHRDLDSICALFDAAARAEETRDHVGVRRVPRHAGRPADPGRHAGRARRPRRRRPPAHRPPRQGSRVAARRRRARPAGRLARPAPAVDAPRRRPDRRRRAGARRPRRARRWSRSAGCSTSPAPAPASGSSSPRSPRPRTTASSRPGSSTSSASSVEHVDGRPPAHAVAGRAGQRAAADRRRPGHQPGAARRRRPGGSPGWPGRPSATAPLVPMADPSTWWGTRAATRSVTPVRDPDQPVPVSASLLDAHHVCPTQWFLAREAGGVARVAPVRQPRRDRARPRPAGRRGRARGTPDAAGVEPLMDHVDAGLGPAGVPHPVGQGTRARPGPGRAGPVPRSGTTRNHADACSASSSSSGGARPAGRRAGAARRVRRPARARRRRPGRGRRPQDQPRQADRQVACPTNVQLGLYQLAVDHGARRRAGSREPPRPAAPSSSSSGCATAARRPIVQRQPAQADDGPEREAAPRPARPAPRRLLRDRAVPGGRRRPLPRLPVRADLPGQERRAGGGPVSGPPAIDSAERAGRGRWARTGVASEQQWAAISAPLAARRRRSPAPGPARPR